MTLRKVTLEGVTHIVRDFTDEQIVCDGFIWWDTPEETPKSEPLTHVKEITCKECLAVLKAFKSIKGRIKS